MKKRKYIYGLVALTLLVLLPGCEDQETAIDTLSEDLNIIHIGGVETATVQTSLGDITTRAAGDNAPVDAETVDWLLGPLFGGLDITYGAKDKPETQKVAILQLLKKDENGGISASNIKYSGYTGPNGEKIAEYSFKYRGSDEDAKWYDNGEHYFQGVFVPNKLRYVPANNESLVTVNGASSTKAPNLKTDQSKDVTDNVDANYTLLERYLGMPADAYIHATVGRIKLPFRHRLARVQAYVLIDPTMGSDVTVKGYKKDADGNNVSKEDATTSAIRFCNVKVLAGVKEVDETNGHATLTPQWDNARKAIPHFVGESGSKNSLGEVKDENFIMYYNTELKTYIFPTDDENWVTANSAWNSAYTTALGAGTSDEDKRKAADKADAASGYKRTLYGKVPVYDLIVRPTYKSEEMVMYDEEDVVNKRSELAAQTNKIDFEITLNNGLEYTKEFEFDLDANHQNVVYLRINRESIDYNSSGAEVWKEDTYNDGYYGVNNQNGNTLSFAGSSWQRAYRIGSKTDNVTDGHWYGKDDPNDDHNVQDDDAMPWYPQYVSQERWVEMFAEAHAVGLHHGDYFILDSDITIDARQLPDNFVFTGHLDGQDHTITLTNGGKNWTDYVATTYYSISPLYSDKNGTVYNLPTLYTKVHHDANYTSDDEFVEIESITYIKRTLKYNEEVWHEATEEDVTNGSAENVGDKVIDKPESYEVISYSLQKQDAYDEYNETHTSMAEAMAAAVDTYYEKTGENSYEDFFNRKPSVLYNAVSHTSGSTLFAGLNGAYDAAIGEANVHKEGNIYVPYVDATSKTGWRAEVINTKISGADMFPTSVIVDGKYDVTKVSGYIYNCWKGSERIMPHTPTLPKYK